LWILITIVISIVISIASPVVEVSATFPENQAPLFPPVIDPNDLLPANGGDGSEGFVVNGAFSSQSFGMAVAMGDFDGDGYTDLLSGFVPNAPPAIAPPSGVALVFGRRIMPMGPDGLETEPVFANGDAAPDLLRLAIEDRTLFRGWLGWRTRNLGDLDGDGIDDLAFVNRGGRLGQFAGLAFVVYGTPEVGASFANYTNLLPEFGGTGQAGFVLRGTQSFEFLGQDISAGDINGDGLTDLALLSERQYAPDRLRGIGYVIYGRPGRNMPAETTLDELLDAAPEQGFAIVAPVPEGSPPQLVDRAFQSIRVVPDLNGDDLDDIVLCRPQNQFPDTNFNGECYVIFGRSGQTPFPARFDLGDLLSRNVGDGSQGFVIIGREAEAIGSGDATGNRNGYAVDGIGDFDGDGFNDLLISAVTFSGIGKAYLFFGQGEWPTEIDLRDGLDTVREQVRLTEFHRFFEPPEDRLGFGEFVGGIGDINNDGRPDIMISAEPPVVQYAGGWVIFGHADPADDFVVEGLLPEHGGDGRRGFLIRDFEGPFGIKRGAGSAMAGGDFNGDGIDDVALGSRLANPGNRNRAGRLIVLYGRGHQSLGVPAIGIGGLIVLSLVLLIFGSRTLSRLRGI